ncbi:hypothetical protein ABW19_dt0201363 [Dactylella cylindrospora]|nr:hypothetical protein ABW19_dt0201363 [Dactylella cylindrospora]
MYLDRRTPDQAAPHAHPNQPPIVTVQRLVTSTVIRATPAFVSLPTHSSNPSQTPYSQLPDGRGSNGAPLFPANFGIGSAGSSTALSSHVDTSRLRKSKTGKVDLAAAVITLLIVAALGTFAFVMYKRRQRKETTNGTAAAAVMGGRSGAVVTEGIDPGRRAQIQLRREIQDDMQRPESTLLLQQYLGVQKHRDEVKKSDNEAGDQRKDENCGNGGNQGNNESNNARAGPSTAGRIAKLSPAKERYYRAQGRGKLFRSGGK